LSIDSSLSPRRFGFTGELNFGAGGGGVGRKKKTNPVGENHHKLRPCGAPIPHEKSLSSPRRQVVPVPLQPEDEETFAAFVAHFQAQSAALTQTASSSATSRARMWREASSSPQAMGTVGSPRGQRYSAANTVLVTQEGEGTVQMQLRTSV
jgi:hypothetical protein